LKKEKNIAGTEASPVAESVRLRVPTVSESLASLEAVMQQQGCYETSKGYFFLFYSVRLIDI